MTTHVIYHGLCYDGFTAAWAAWTALGGKAKYIPARYGDEPPQLPIDAQVVIVDFSYPREKLMRMAASVKSLVVLDHHKTAKEDLEGFPGTVFDMGHSGAFLAWRYFHPNEPPPALVRYVEDRDLWRFNLPDSKAVSAYIQSFACDFNEWNAIHEKLERDIGSAVSEGGAILRARMQTVKLMADNHKMMEVGGFTVPAANATAYSSEVAQELLRRFPDAPFAACYMDRADGRRQWALRSSGKFDVSKVAQSLGGGGHDDAAGFVEPSTSEIISGDDRDRGLYNKFIVKRTNGSSEPGGKHEKCRYFVLDIDHDKYCIPALEAYAEACKEEFPVLSTDLKEWVSKTSWTANDKRTA